MIRWSSLRSRFHCDADSAFLQICRKPGIELGFNATMGRDLAILRHHHYFDERCYSGPGFGMADISLD